MKQTNKHNLPAPIVRALSRDSYSRGASNRSITQLIDSPRVRIMQTEHDDDMTEDVSDLMWSVLGTAVHNIFEDGAKASGISGAEERLFVDVQGWSISGAMDLQEVGYDGDFGGDIKLLTDYKCTSVWSVIFGKVEWVNQLNAYSWLARKAKGFSPDKLRVVAVLRDWNRRESERNPDYPKAPIHIHEVPRWSDEQQDEYMEGRIALHQQAEFDRLVGEPVVFCSDAERWMKPTTYAVKKNANKRAVRVFKTMEEAEEEVERLVAADVAKAATMKKKPAVAKYHVEERKGEPTRCMGDYCHVAKFCDQFQSEVWSA